MNLKSQQGIVAFISFVENISMEAISAFLTGTSEPSWPDYLIVSGISNV